MKNLRLLLLAICTVLLLVACSGEGKLTTFKSDDGDYQVRTTSDWEDAEGSLNEEADLQINNLRKEKYFIALIEAKEDLGDASLNDYYDFVTEPFISSLEDVTQSDVGNVTVNGNDALQYTVEGTIDNIEIVYLVTIVETPTHYAQLMAWTLKSKWNELKDEYEDVVNSFDAVK